MKDLTLEDVIDFHKTFYGGQNGTLTVVGDFDEDKIMAKSKMLFGDWTNNMDYKRIADPYVAVKPADEKIETPDKSNSMFFACLLYTSPSPRDRG